MSGQPWDNPPVNQREKFIFPVFRGEHINFLARLTLGQPAVCPRAIWTLTRAKSLCLCAFFSWSFTVLQHEKGHCPLFRVNPRCGRWGGVRGGGWEGKRCGFPGRVFLVQWGGGDRRGGKHGSIWQNFGVFPVFYRVFWGPETA